MDEQKIPELIGKKIINAVIVDIDHAKIIKLIIDSGRAIYLDKYETNNYIND